MKVDIGAQRYVLLEKGGDRAGPRLPNSYDTIRQVSGII